MNWPIDNNPFTASIQRCYDANTTNSAIYKHVFNSKPLQMAGCGQTVILSCDVISSRTFLLKPQPTIIVSV